MKLLFTCLLSFMLLNSNLFAQNSDIKPAPFVLGRIDTVTSTILAEHRILNIYLPEGYQQDTATYPVIYLLDGSANEDFIHIVGIVQFLTMIEAMPKSIVVGIANVDRKRDFTFPATNKEHMKMVPTAGGAAKFISFVADELQPYIERKYRTNTSKTIIGQSLGGLLATEILLEKPDLFNTYIIVSPSLWWNDESLLSNAKASVQQINKNTTVYISVGTEGKQMEGDAKKLDTILKASGKGNIKTYFAPMPAENHLTILHNSVYNAFLTLYAKKPKVK